MVTLPETLIFNVYGVHNLRTQNTMPCSRVSKKSSSALLQFPLTLNKSQSIGLLLMPWYDVCSCTVMYIT